MANLEFAVLPFVKVDGPIDLGSLTVWPSTVAEWKARMGVAPPAILDVYRNRSGDSAAGEVSILSPNALEPVSVGQFQDAVVVLSTADWLRGLSGTASDAWVCEPWRIDETNDSHVRAGKFSLNFTDSQDDRLYPDPYTYPVRFNRYGSEDVVNQLRPLLTSGAEDARNRLTALWHLYLARRGAPYFGSIFEDLEAVWSAFEAWYRLPRTPDYQDNTRIARAIRAWVPRALSRRLRESAWVRDSRSTLVYRGVSCDLGPILDQRFAKDLENLLDDIYRMRSEQSHGGTPAPERLRREDQDAHVLGLALSVWRILLELDLFKDDLLTASHLSAKLRDTFLERSLHDKLLAAFANRARTDWCGDDGRPGDLAHVQAQEELFREVVQVAVIPRRYRGTAAPRNACRAALLALSAWSKHLETGGSRFSTEPATKGLHAAIGSTVAAKPKDVNSALVDLILRRKLHEPDTFDDALLSEIGSLGGTDFPTWAHVIVRLHELAVGHELV